MAIRVTLKNPTKRKFFLAQWQDPVTGLVKTRSTKTSVKRDALKFAGKLEAELNAGTFRDPLRTTWRELVDRYVGEVSPSKARATQYKMEAMDQHMRDLVNPHLVSSITASEISTFTKKLRKLPLEEATIHGHLRELRKLLRWGVKMELVARMPHIEFPTVIASAKGRAITGEEFDRFLQAVPKIITVPEFVPGWEFLARGLWWSGLRIEEAMLMEWDNDEFLRPWFDGRRPQFRIEAIGEKGRQFRFLPMAPEFADMLQQIPEAERRGFVFNPWTRPPKSVHGPVKGRHRPSTNHVSRTLAKIGTEAKITVTKSKDASAHDFRRSFGTRWAKKVPTLVLMEMMRHDDIETTQAYYLTHNADETADTIWAAAGRESGNTSGNTSQEHDDSVPAESAKNP